jgi:hypothetical protein
MAEEKENETEGAGEVPRDPGHPDRERVEVEEEQMPVQPHVDEEEVAVQPQIDTEEGPVKETPGADANAELVSEEIAAEPTVDLFHERAQRVLDLRVLYASLAQARQALAEHKTKRILNRIGALQPTDKQHDSRFAADISKQRQTIELLKAEIVGCGEEGLSEHTLEVASASEVAAVS